MYILGHCGRSNDIALFLPILRFDEQVVYQAGVNEKLLGDFIRKHNVRDKVFRTFEDFLTTHRYRL